MKDKTLSYYSMIVFVGIFVFLTNTANANVMDQEPPHSSLRNFFSSFRKSSHKSNEISFPEYNIETHMCTVDHNMIMSEEDEVSISVKIAMATEGTGLVQLTFNDGEFAGLNDVRGWCVDLGRLIGSGDYSFDVFSSLDTSGAIHADAVDKPQYLPALNWLMNEIPTGTVIDVPDCVENHAVTDQEYQLATWLVIDDASRKEVFDGWKVDGKIEEDTCVVDWLVEQTLASQQNYEPSCYNSNAKIGLLLVVDDDDDTILNQVLLAEIDVRHACKCVAITSSPSTTPTTLPTDSPIKSPTEAPTMKSTETPTKSPTSSPTRGPTTLPTSSPTRGSTSSPTSSPTRGPTLSPTSLPTTKSPTSSPTREPTLSPTSIPTTESPIESPITNFPTLSPTREPTKGLTQTPTDAPTDPQTLGPTPQPTTSAPTRAPSALDAGGVRTVLPTTLPTEGPTEVPTFQPTDTQTLNPTPASTGPDPETTVPTLKETSPQTLNPTSRVITSAPTRVPSKLDAGGVRTEVPSAAPSKYQGASGDPHFKTWSGERYDYHGICDLILLSNQKFNDNSGMDIYIRSKRTKQWSYISTAVIRIGAETFEVSGRKDGDTYWINGIEGDSKAEDDLWEKGTNIAGYPITYQKLHTMQREYIIHLGKNGEAVIFKTWKDFVRVDVVNPRKEDFRGSLGLMGSYPDGKSVSRSNPLSIMKDRNAFGQEWQVLSSDPKLFHSVEGPQHPARCEIPSKSSLRRRLSKSDISIEDAKILCSHVTNKEERDLCVFDVMATSDKTTANAY